MTLEDRITRVEMQLANLQNAYLQSQRNLKPTTDKVYDTANKVTEITPWTASKTAYIEDSECIFNDVPRGNMTVYCPVNYTVERMDGRVTVKFEPLEEVINITISVI